MKTYMKLVNNTLKDYPILESNLFMIYGEFDEDHVPNEFCLIKPDETVIGPYDIDFGNSTYTYDEFLHRAVEKKNFRPMTLEEKNDYIQSLKQNFPFASWSFDEETAQFIPPSPKPENGNYYWNESELKWVEKPSV